MPRPLLQPRGHRHSGDTTLRAVNVPIHFRGSWIEPKPHSLDLVLGIDFTNEVKLVIALTSMKIMKLEN